MEGHGAFPADLLAPADEVEHGEVGRSLAPPFAKCFADEGIAHVEGAGRLGDVAFGEDRTKDFERGSVDFPGEGEHAVGQHLLEPLFGGAELDVVFADGVDLPVDAEEGGGVFALAGDAGGPGV